MTVLVLIHSTFRMWTIPAAQVDRLRTLFPSHTFLHARNDEEGMAMIADANAAWSAQVRRGQLAAARRLRWIHSPAAGIGPMLYPEMVSSGVLITNSRGLSADTIAEHVLALVLALFRRLPLAFERQGERRWAQDEMVAHATDGVPRRPSDAPRNLAANRTIAGAEVLILGLGSIGRAAASRFTALGACVTGVRRQGGVPVPGVAAVHPPSALHDLLPQADVVVLTAPQTVATHHLVGGPELALMKREAVLVNVSRGALIDEDALVDALVHGRIAGAALDVFRDEPLAPDHPLWDVPNLLITPHSAGFRSDHWQAATDLFAENLRRFDAGEPLLNVVDKKEGY